MKSRDLIVNCLAERSKDGLWQALCIDFNLAAQGESFEEARKKLEAQIKEYLFDALVGEDSAFAPQLLRRPAPFRYRVKFHLCRIFSVCLKVLHSSVSTFQETIPLTPKTT